MIERDLQAQIGQMLAANSAVVLIGPRQIGKTTLALNLAEEGRAIYRDLERPREAEQVRDVELFEQQYPSELIILDEVQRLPEIFAPLRGIIDRRRRRGQRVGQFLFLGSASLDLLRQTSESLAGRIAYAELAGVNMLEAEVASIPERKLWLRGGFPDSLLATSDKASLQWRADLIRSYLERDVPQFGFRVPAETLRRFWTMLAHHQGGLLNAASLAKGLGISGQSVARYLDILVDLLLVRRLMPWHSNHGKRLVKSPKIYVRDSGLLHALLDIGTHDQLLGHPVVGFSWEGFVIENLITSTSGLGYQPYFYRTQAGAEIDLVLVRGGQPEVAIEIKRASAPKAEKGLHIACEDLGIHHKYVVYAGEESYLQGQNTWAVSAQTLMRVLAERRDLSFAE
ncbi:MAG: ATP-binding protein [Alphaproteobacteria bacterium]|nr:MAG: ATP-binding protein [Alphaproteobacteria bacterium]